MWLELGHTGLRKKSQLLVCFSSSLGILIVYVKKKGRKKESLVEVFKKSRLENSSTSFLVTCVLGKIS